MRRRKSPNVCTLGLPLVFRDRSECGFAILFRINKKTNQKKSWLEFLINSIKVFILPSLLSLFKMVGAVPLLLDLVHQPHLFPVPS